MGSTLISSKTNVVSALSGLPAVYAGNFALPTVGSSTLVASPSRLGTVPALVSPVITSAPALSSAQSANRVTAGTGPQAECSSTKSSAVAPPLLKSSRPLSSLPVIPSQSVGALHSPFIPVPGPLSTAAASVVADAPLFHCSLPAQQVVAVTALGPSMHPQQTTVRVAAPSTVHQPELVQQGPANLSIKKQVPVMQPVLAGTRTQVLPTVAVPPIVSALSRTQALPIATVPPNGSTVRTFETAPVAVASPSSTSVIINPAQAITSQTSKNTIPSPVILTNQALGKHSVQTSSLSMHTNVTSKLLISPDGAVLSTVHCQVNPAELTACPKPLDALVTSSNSSTGALQTHDSALQPTHTNTK